MEILKVYFRIPFTPYYILSSRFVGKNGKKLFYLATKRFNEKTGEYNWYALI